MKKNTVKVAQTFRWEMGHRLPYHQRGCRNLHGHSYKLIVEIEGVPAENDGIVLDFFEIRDIVQPAINKLDHSFMCSQDDDLLKTFFKNTDFKVVYVDFYSTAENIALYFIKLLSEKLKSHKNLTAVTVRVYETEKEYAEVTEEFK